MADSDLPAEHPLQRRLVSLAALSIAAFLVLAVTQRVGLYADGSYFLFRLIGEARPPGVSPRVIGEWTVSLPVLIALRLGIQRTIWLEWIFGVSLFAHFAVMLWICARACRHRASYLLFPASSFVLLSANMGFWSFTGSHLLVSLFWSLLFALHLPHPWTRRWMWLSLALSAMAMAVFESMLVLGPILAAVALSRARQETDPTRRRGALISAALCLAGACVSLWGISVKESGHFTKALFDFADGAGRPHGMLLLSCLALLVVAMPLLAPASRRAHHVWQVGAGVLVLGVVGWLVAVIVSPTATISVSVQHDVRTFNLWITLVLAALFLVHDRWRRTTDVTRVWRIIAVMALAQTTNLAIQTIHWRHYLALVARDTRAGRGIVPFENTALNASRDGYYLVSVFSWSWTTPVLSLLSARDGMVTGIIANPVWYRGWSPLPLHDPRELQALEAYGYRVDSVRAAWELPRDPLTRRR